MLENNNLNKSAKKEKTPKQLKNNVECGILLVMRLRKGE